MQIARWYFVALLCIPFYIGPSLATNAQLNAERLLVVLLVFAFFTRVVNLRFGHSFKELYSARPLTLMAFIFYFSWRGLAAALSPQTVSMLLFINEFMTEVFMAFVFYGFFFVKDYTDPLIKVLKASVVFIFAIVCLEIVLKQNPFSAFAPADAGNAIKAAAIERAGLIRAKGTFEHPLTLAYFVISVLPFFLFGDRARGFTHRRLFVLGLVLIGVATGSRTALGMMFVELVVYVLISKPAFGFNAKRLDARLVLIPAVLLLLPLIIMLAEQRAGASLLQSNARTAQLTNGLIAIWNQPWFGYGQGQGPTQAIETAMKYGEGSIYMWEENFNTIDNWFLSVALSSGLPSLIAFVAYLFAVVVPPIVLVTSAKVRVQMRDNTHLGLVYALILSCAAQMGFMAILSIFTLHPLYFIFSFWLISLHILYARMRQRDQKPLPFSVQKLQ
ncbi:O-antigen ligase family protein [Celeribacter baekdonensis]|uniref:O-antigen ligase family protein n=1 Tax=Pseudomonadota TaxID=1224 RepID=UPI003A953D64|tara:strand:- start:10879 stop:12213 length:1335 start_codon:yes stop_codon:yes gene_type:complete